MKELIQNRSLLIFSTTNYLKQKFAGQILGIVWLLILPIILLSIYLLVYLYIFKLKPTTIEVETYILYTFSGLVPFIAISEALSLGANSLSANESVLKNITFPISIFPAQATIVPHLTMLIGFFIVLCLDAYLDEISIATLLLPVIILAQIIFMLGLNYLLCLINVVIKDFQNLISFISMGIMLISPIGYLPETVSGNVHLLISLNPFYYFFRCYQSVIAFNKMPSFYEISIPMVLAIVSFSIGSLVFSKAKKVIASYV